MSELTTVDLGAVVRRCWAKINTADASLRVGTDASIRADPGRLQQLLENLLRNAIEHGGPDVTITVGDLDSGVFVADDGTGIPPKDRTDVFESGYTTTPDGTGFGLAIVAEIADAHGWAVRATDGTDGGVRFEITGVERSVDCPDAAGF